MIQSFITVFQQIVILFIMIGVGYVCSKRGFLSPLTIKELSKFIIYVVTPCIVVESIHRPFDSSMMGNIAIACAAAAGAHLLNIILSRVLIRDREQNRRVVYQFATIFSNCGFMGLPLQYAILGIDGVFYGGLLYDDRLKSAFKSRVFFDVFTILVEGGCADALYLAS